MRTSVGIRGALVFSLSVLASSCFPAFPSYTWERMDLKLEIGADLSGSHTVVGVGLRSTDHPNSAVDTRRATEQLCSGDAVSALFDMMNSETKLPPGDSLEAHTIQRGEGQCDTEWVLLFKDLERVDRSTLPYDLTRTENRLTVEGKQYPATKTKPADDRNGRLYVHYAGRILEHNATQVDAQTGWLSWDLKSDSPRLRFVLDAPRQTLGSGPSTGAPGATP